MDIKLKNRHRLGVVLIVIIILAASAGIIGLYPYIKQRTEESQVMWTSRHNDTDMAENLAPQVMNWAYVLWHERAQEEAGRILTPSQVFLPGLREELREQDEARRQDTVTVEDVYPGYAYSYVSGDSEEYYDRLTTMQNVMDSRGADWKANWKQMKDGMPHTMKDSDGTIVVSENSEVGGSELPLEKGSIRVNISFSDTGIMQVDSVTGNELKTDTAVDALGMALGKMTYFDPLRERMSEDYLYSDFQFTGPRNVSYEFVVSQEKMALNWTNGRFDSYYVYQSDYLPIIFSFFTAMALSALLLPCFSSLGIGRQKIFRVPFEVVVPVMTCLGALYFGSDLPLTVIGSTLDGTVYEELLKARFVPGVAVILQWCMNMAFWAVGLGLVYWGITCVRAVFQLGLWRYIKERTLVGICIGGIGRKFNQAFLALEEIDWNSGSTKLITKLVVVNFLILTVISMLWFWGIGALIIYSIVLFGLLRRYWHDMKKKYGILLGAINQIADGNLDVEIDENLGVFEPFRGELDKIQTGFKKAVREEVKSQKMKTELVTNVSHDLKTPLTAIITYVNLLKNDNVTADERKSYINVLEQKSLRLKFLIEDLFEISKATSGSTTLNLMDVDIVNLMKQVSLEMEDRIQTSGVNFRWNLPDEKVVLSLDSQKTYRVFENLIMNIVKYALPGTRAYIDVIDVTEPYGETMQKRCVTISMRNISAVELNINPQELTERFVRGDESRNTEGSGLGLAIVKSFVELQGGRITIETEADLFRVIIQWETLEPIVHKQEEIVEVQEIVEIPELIEEG